MQILLLRVRYILPRVDVKILLSLLSQTTFFFQISDVSTLEIHLGRRRARHRVVADQQTGRPGQTQILPTLLDPTKTYTHARTGREIKQYFH